MTQIIKYAKIKNYKGAKDIEIHDPSRWVVIFGANGAGKTSFIEAIKSAIKLEKGGNDKVTIGEKKGEIEVHFDDFKIKRIIGSNGKLEVEHNGELVSRPQAWLDGIFMGVIGDPQKFLNLQRKDKIRYILETHGKKEDYDALESARSILFEERKDVHRRTLAKEEEVKDVDASQFELLDDATGDISDLEKQLEEGESHNKTLYDLETRKEKGLSYVRQQEIKFDNKSDDIAQIDREIARLQERKKSAISDQDEISVQLRDAKETLQEIEKEIADFNSVDLSEIKEQISTHYDQKEAIASARAKKEMHDQNVAKATELRSNRQTLDTEIKEIEEQQNDLIRDIDISYNMRVVDGEMSVEIDGLRVPLDDLNTATQIDLGVDICLNGPNKVKIITIENANTLDPKTMARVKKKVEAAGGQCFLETVYPTEYDSITIENGQVA